VTNHDIKAVEYYIKGRLQLSASLSSLQEFVHFTCTSEDINNISHALMLRDACNFMQSKEEELIKKLKQMVNDYADCAMMARTHG
jgi:adenylosuccinate lyase